ncbi:hypothetical protein RDI58_012909 [Solanum bulbocastanum]|uniref:Protein kinase domain-containing protein n=1 Tax=Solanum bulbocastanum TaxID=147425 RepID=A0AAN8TJU0_SOLBU
MGGKHSKGTTLTSHRVPFAALQEATNNLDEKFVIADDGFGKLDRGVLCDGTKVDLKMYDSNSQQNDLEEFQTEIEILSQSQQGIAEFQTEIMILSQLRHMYLVSLIGYCDENNEMILIYDYMENGNLKRHLYGYLPTMSWEQRLEICIGAARGLHYFHNNGIIHRDVKSPNILLDENFVPKIADFGLSKKVPELEQTHVNIVVRGSNGYIDPEYFVRQQLTEKSDVYSFVVVLCEVVCARPAVDQSLPREQVNLAELAEKGTTQTNHRSQSCWQNKTRFPPEVWRNRVEMLS